MCLATNEQYMYDRQQCSCDCAQHISSLNDLPFVNFRGSVRVLVGKTCYQIPTPCSGAFTSNGRIGACKDQGHGKHFGSGLVRGCG